MPWTPADAATHIKGLSPKQARGWAAIANSALTRCLKAGGTQKDCEGSAIRQANGVAQHIGEADLPADACVADALAASGIALDALPTVVEATQAALAALDADALSEASTTKAQVQAHLKAAADAMRAHKHPVAKMMAKHLDSMRSLLQSGYGGVGSLFDATPPAPAAESDLPAGAAILAGLLMQEAASILRQDDGYDARRAAVQQALCADPQTRVDDGDADDQPDALMPSPYPCIVDLFDDVVVYQYGDDLYRRPYTLGTDEDPDTITFGPPEPVERAYVPVGEAAMVERQMDPAVGGGTDRDKLPAADFAGKNRSFPIATPQDVADAARSIGRAGADNYSTDELKRRIIAIAKRKGAAFVAQLPEAWKGDTQESAADAPPLSSTPTTAAAATVALVEAGALVDCTPVAEAGALVGAT